MNEELEIVTIVEAKYVGDYKLELVFSDGLNSIVDLEEELWGSAFEPLKDQSVFKDFILDGWTVTWPCGADFSPNFLHRKALISAEMV